MPDARPSMPSFIPRVLVGVAAMLCLAGTYLLVSGRSPLVGMVLLAAGVGDAVVAFILARHG
ncbi:MAG: hypothetical protein KC544_03000 [Gemmatimonadetes bacterium]|nr:hypothetical protein [Gemmatimonadota bacterium]MCB9505042.1 hypothetical protein [Gemmatimonadales bacterium]MCA9762080.1 hypothetical protein [Gemmatimonadota bacterium]MCA9767866.1 hypothetical protein [Gemmatimonadota bacterium]MCB9517745.1 hypothetical protein [Gemmatimonadales bacterium]